ncbi:PP2C family protein-serine/threonine phosphatase, partial [Arsukibacterium sp.]|uniref:PP2C family protein-serine/threonine phosphatase n=1 Tax=Arsukibacterium sp. TaxID=1977258 RepID=UPI002FD8D895
GTKTATTLVALLLFKNQLVSAHAGDSRLYQFNRNGKVGQTKDHSLAYAKFLLGEITEQQLATHPSQSQLLNCINGDADIQIDINHWSVENGQYFLLCTDGFWEMFSDADIVELIQSEQREALMLERLQAQLQHHPRHDNTTVVIVALADIKDSMVATDNSAATSLRAQLATEPKNLANSKPKNTSHYKTLFIVLLVIALLVLLASFALYRPYACCTKPIVPELTTGVTITSRIHGLQGADTDIADRAEQAGDSTSQLNDNLQNHHELEIALQDNEDALQALWQKLLEQGDISSGTVLDKVSVSSDQYAEIITVQLKINNTPVYGALLRYRKTASGIKVMAGKTANLPLLPAAPTHDFSSCFKQYQDAQAASNPVTLITPSAEVLYIDAASQSYFWLTPINFGTASVPHDLFLSDNNCDALRLISRHVSG